MVLVASIHRVRRAPGLGAEAWAPSGQARPQGAQLLRRLCKYELYREQNNKIYEYLCYFFSSFLNYITKLIYLNLFIIFFHCLFALFYSILIFNLKQFY